MSSYRLESPRPRSQLPPIRTRSSYAPSSLGSPTTLLYDLPQSSSARSPPPQSTDTFLYSPPSKTPPIESPTHSRQRPRQTPPPRTRSATPAQVARQELDQFATCCRSWYFDQDERAGQLMTQTLESLDASQRAPFSRLQASIRSAYHAAMARRRRTEFRAHLSSTHPGGSLSLSSRANPSSKAAKKERYNRFFRFIRTWCTSGMPGPRPFFQALWAVMRLQILPLALGGAGPNRIEWEFDDAVFQESAGKEFMLEAIDVLKGALGFEEFLPSQPQRQQRGPTDEMVKGPILTTPISMKPQVTRPRSPSDPFMDTPALSQFDVNKAPPPQSPNLNSNNQGLITSESDTLTELPGASRHTKESDEDNEGPSLRVWTTADISNPEYQALISLFPDFICRNPFPRFPIRPARPLSLEEGATEHIVVSCGTGRMWVGGKLRINGWQGSWWHRFTGWWRRLFGRR